ncbi:glycosyltransferase family A protein [Mucilaginibacter sp. CSA2-8R]|uniref:glycosyltransferase family 2 protein n=1 Tax=Mucilaginibacter sp. CSA2-8R TaxID=3141542 RepID=UPI00315CDAE4
MPPKISVIIPNYNRAAIIGETIDNMLSQTLKPHQIIVVDDGSADDSIKVVKGFGDKVILIEQKNAGPGAARNAGLKIATGDFIQFMDSDDLASLNKLEVQVQALIQHNADIVLGPWLKAWMEDKTMRLENVVLQQKPLPSTHTTLQWFLTGWSMVFQQSLIRKSILIKAGGYREDIKYFEDGDLFVKLLLAGGKLIFESASLTFYRLNDFGKLTGDGQVNTGRAHAQATFYQDIIRQSKTSKVLQDCVELPDFRANVYNAYLDLEKSNLQLSSEYLDLITMAQHSKSSGKFSALYKKVQAGIKQRIHGHRWPESYQAGALQAHQKQLITQMGYNLI